MKMLNREIGDRIGALRRMQNYTQEQFSELLDVTVKHISSVECGKSSLSMEKLIKVSKIFDCSLDYLITGEDFNSVSVALPRSILEILYSNDQKEINLLLEYMRMYGRIRKRAMEENRLVQKADDSQKETKENHG